MAKSFLSPVITAVIFTSFLIGISSSSAKPFRHEFGELREYHKHWLGVCDDNAVEGCRAVAMTHTSEDGFFLRGRLAVNQNPQTGDYTIKFLDEDEAYREDSPVTFKFSDGTRLTFDRESVAPSPRVYPELAFQNQSEIMQMLSLMRSQNHMVVLIGQSRYFYSLMGFSSAMRFMAKYRPAPPVQYTGPVLNTADFWGGEWPRGFTMKADTLVKARKNFDTDLAKDVSCTLKKGATYHPWNHKRNKLTPMTFKTKETAVVYQVTKNTTIKLERENDRELEEIQFKAGDEWAFITYYGEGLFRLSYKGKLYIGEEQVYQWSADMSGGTDRFLFEEWLGLPCDNGVKGWILLADLGNIDEPEENSPFSAPNFLGYGVAEDLVDGSVAN